MAKAKKEPRAEKLSKKELFKTVFEKLSGSISEYHLKEKKQKKRLEKVSKLLAGDIVKVLKKEHVEKDPQALNGQEHTATRSKKARRAKKSTKIEKAIAAES
jgi:hypothetical protein